MTIKTYSRARAAKAALIKILDMHEEVGTVNTIEVEDGRFTADVHFVDIPALGLQEDLMAAGFAMYWPTAEEAPTEAETLIEVPVDDVTLVEVPPFEDLPEALDALGVEPKAPRKPTYVAEVSTAEGPTKRVWAIADSMPGSTRKQVIDACREAGIAFGTARTQYQKWFTANKVE